MPVRGRCDTAGTAQQPCNALEQAGIAAPKDGRAPLNTYPLGGEQGKVEGAQNPLGLAPAIPYQWPTLGKTCPL